MSKTFKINKEAFDALNKAIEEGRKKIRRTDIKKLNSANSLEYNANIDKQRQEASLALIDLYERMDGDIDNVFDSLMILEFGANEDQTGELNKDESIMKNIEADADKLINKSKNTRTNKIAKEIEKSRKEAIESISNNSKYSKAKKKELIDNANKRHDNWQNDHRIYIKKLKKDLENRNKELNEIIDENKAKEKQGEIDRLNKLIGELSPILALEKVDKERAEKKLKEVKKREDRIKTKSELDEELFVKKTRKENREDFHKNGVDVKRRWVNNETGEEFEEVEHFIYLGRSSSQARVGKEIAIRESKTVTNLTTGEVITEQCIDNKRIVEEFKGWLNDFVDESKQNPVTLGSYSSLVFSKIEQIVPIDPDKMMCVPDIEKHIYKEGYVTRRKSKIVKDKNGNDVEEYYLETTKEDNVDFCNSIFDGQALGSKEFFEVLNKEYGRKGGSQLGRWRFGKANINNIDFQEFFRDRFEEDKKAGKIKKDMKFEDYTVTSLEGTKIKASEVIMIFSPSTVKNMKLYITDENGKELSDIEKIRRFKQMIREDGCTLAIVKEEHESKTEDILGDEIIDETIGGNNQIQNSSYQQMSSVKYRKGIGEDLFSKFDKGIMNKINEDPSFYMYYLKENATDVNNYKHHLTMLEKGGLAYWHTEECQKAKKEVLNEYKKKLRKGAVHLKGCYNTISMNVAEMCEIAWNMEGFIEENCKETEKNLTTYTLNDDYVSPYFGKRTLKIELKDKDGNIVLDEKGNPVMVKTEGCRVYTKSFPAGEELCLYRNPNATRSNLCPAINVADPTKNDVLAKLAKNFTDNMIIMDGTEYECQPVLQGMDMDSDSVLITNNEDCVKTAKTKKQDGYLNIALDKSVSKPSTTEENARDHMAEANDRTSSSGLWIGRTANIAQALGCQLEEVRFQLSKEDLDKQVAELRKDKDYIKLQRDIKKGYYDEANKNSKNDKAKGKYEKLHKELNNLAKKYDLNKWIVQQSEDVKIRETLIEMDKDLEIELAKMSNIMGCAIDMAKREFYIDINKEIKISLSKTMKDLNDKTYVPLFFGSSNVMKDNPSFEFHNTMDDLFTTNMSVDKNIEVTQRLEDLFDQDMLNKDRTHIKSKQADYAWELIIETHKKIKDYRRAISQEKDRDNKRNLELEVRETVEALIESLKDVPVFDKDGNIVMKKNGKRKGGALNQATIYRIIRDSVCPPANVKDFKTKMECFYLVAEIFTEIEKCMKVSDNKITPFDKRKKRQEMIEKEVFNMAMEQCNLYKNDVEDLAKETIKIMREKLSGISSGEFDDKIKDILKEHEEKLTEIRNRINIDGVVEHSYNKTLYNFSKDIGFAVNFNKLNAKTIKAILTEPLHSKTFDERLNNSVQRYSNEFKAILLNMHLQGLSIQQAVNMFNQQTDYNCKAVSMIIRTQVTYYSNLSQAEAIKQIGAKKYIYCATLDSRTSTICQEKDGKVFDVDDKDNLPPQHPNCRSTIITFWDNEILDNNRTRLAKDENGKWVKVGNNITYQEYAEKYLK